MGFVFPVAAILAGLLAASNVVISKLPNAKDLIDKLAPYQAGIGIVALVMGAFSIFDWSTITGRMSGSGSAMVLVCIISSIVVGFLLGFPLIQKYLLEDMSESSRQKGENLRAKLLPFQIIGGLGALVSGVYLLFMIIIS